MCGEREKSDTKVVHCSCITLKDQAQPSGEKKINMQNLISVRRHWTFHPTSVSHSVIGCSDAISKVIQQMGAFSSVRRFR